MPYDRELRPTHVKIASPVTRATKNTSAKFGLSPTLRLRDTSPTDKQTDEQQKNLVDFNYEIVEYEQAAHGL